MLSFADLFAKKPTNSLSVHPSRNFDVPTPIIVKKKKSLFEGMSDISDEEAYYTGKNFWNNLSLFDSALYNDKTFFTPVDLA